MNYDNYTNKEYFKTYDEWKELGYHVIRGEKSVGRNDENIAVFHEDQVEEDGDDNFSYHDLYDFDSDIF